MLREKHKRCSRPKYREDAHHRLGGSSHWPFVQGFRLKTQNILYLFIFSGSINFKPFIPRSLLSNRRAGEPLYICVRFLILTVRRLH